MIVECTVQAKEEDLRNIKYKHYVFDHFNPYHSSDVSVLARSFYRCYVTDNMELDVADGSKMAAEADSIGNMERESMASVGGPIDSPWPMKCHDTRHTGKSPYGTASNNGVEMWRFETDGWIEDNPTIDCDGTIYFGGSYDSLPEYLYAINPDGTLKWRCQLDGLIWGSSPAINKEGTIYIGTWGGYLFAINSDGAEKWRFYAQGTIASSPAIGKDGTIYFGTMRGFDKGDIYAVNPDGTEKWHYTTDYYITSDPAIGEDGTVYIGSGDTYLYAMNADGTLQWRFKTGHYIKGPPSIDDDGTIYVGSYDDYLYALYPDGSPKWKYKLKYGTETNPSIGPDGTIYVGDDKLYAVNQDGTLKWTFDLGLDRHIHQSSPAISADGTIFVGTIIGEGAGGEIIAINSDGTEKWRSYKIADEWVQSSPSIGEDGTVYIGSSSLVDGNSFGFLHAFGAGEPNNPPDKPTITGPTSGKAGEYHRYTFQTTDPEDHEIYYYIDWGDDTSTHVWVGPYNSGEALSLDHLYTFEGTYIIKAKAKDRYDMESDWSTLEVSMPKNKELNNLSFLQLLEKITQRFPILEQIFFHHPSQ